MEVACAAAAVGLAVAAIVQLAQSSRLTLSRVTSTHALNAAVDDQLHSFGALPYGTAPDIALENVGNTDSGAVIHIVKATSFDAALGLRQYSVAAFTPNPVFASIGGAARLEPMATTRWRPDGTSVPIGASAHVLTLASGNSSRGSVEGGGTFPFGSVVQIVARPNPGRTFGGWAGTAQVANRNAAVTTVTIDEDRSLTAVFN